MKIGLFGGCFDPIHKGHVEVIKAALDQKFIDIVLIIINKTAYYKKHTLSDIDIRTAMIRDLLKTVLVKYNVTYDVTDIKYTIDMYKHYKLIYGASSLYLIVGGDCITDILYWKHGGKILKNNKLLVSTRGLITIPKSENIVILNTENNYISSTKIRSNIDKYKDYLFESTYKYIKERKLYVSKI